MTLLFQNQLSQDFAFRNRTKAGWVQAANNVGTEVTVDQQTITGTATGGTGTITANGQTTGTLQFNAGASEIQVALNALSTIGAGGVECTGGPLGTAPVVVNFIGATVQGAQPVVILGTGSLTGGTWTVAHTTTGTWVLNHAKKAVLAKAVLNGTGPSLDQQALSMAGASTVQGDFGSDNTPLNGTITGATGNGVNPIVLTVPSTAGLVNGQLVDIANVGGETAANVLATAITVVNGTSFSIPVTGNGTYTSGGTWKISESQITTDMNNWVAAIFVNFA